MIGQRTEGASLSRLGGDEFTVILENVPGPEAAANVAQRLLDALAKPLKMGDEEVHISASIGISLFPGGQVDLDTLIRNTDLAMYRSKELGRCTYSFYSHDLNAAVSARLSLEGSLRRAVERGEFFLHYQPKANLATGQVTGVEALIRWRCPGRGVVTPDRFVSVLEDTGLIVQAGAWVIREACKQAACWDAQGLPPLNVAVNLSARQLRDAQLVSLVRDALTETGIAPNRLELELTESLLLEDTPGNRAALVGLRELGVRLAIDDFGTGQSSLAYLRRLDVDTLKIDRSFVMQLPDDPEDAAIAKAVVALGKSLGMNVVAEGVETEAQAQFLQSQGCNDMQGWLLSKALAPEPMAAWLRARQLELLQRPVGNWAPSRAAQDLVDPDAVPSPSPAPNEAASPSLAPSFRAA
jgi:predicted signal transduction protein with EAL and GGDEF domain